MVCSPRTGTSGPSTAFSSGIKVTPSRATGRAIRARGGRFYSGMAAIKSSENRMVHARRRMMGSISCNPGGAAGGGVEAGSGVMDALRQGLDHDRE